MWWSAYKKNANYRTSSVVTPKWAPVWIQLELSTLRTHLGDVGRKWNQRACAILASWYWIVPVEFATWRAVIHRILCRFRSLRCKSKKFYYSSCLTPGISGKVSNLARAYVIPPDNINHEGATYQSFHDCFSLAPNLVKFRYGVFFNLYVHFGLIMARFATEMVGFTAHKNFHLRVRAIGGF